MAKSQTFRNTQGLNKALRKLPKHANKRIRDAAEVIARDVAEQASGRARSVGGIARHVAPTIRSGRDRVPVVRMGDSSRLPTAGDGWSRERSGSGQTVGHVIFGAEFGSNRFSQFSPWTGKTGRFLWPTVRDMNEEIQDEYSEALMDALNDVK